MNKITIGVRREGTTSETPGPGTYHLEQADNLTMTRTVAVDFSKQTERLNQIEGNLLGPGQYEILDSFGGNMNKFTIGVRREETTLHTPGPGTFNPELADNLTMTRAVAVDFSKQTERLN